MLHLLRTMLNGRPAASALVVESEYYGSDPQQAQGVLRPGELRMWQRSVRTGDELLVRVCTAGPAAVVISDGDGRVLARQSGESMLELSARVPHAALFRVQLEHPGSAPLGFHVLIATRPAAPCAEGRRKERVSAPAARRLQ